MINKIINLLPSADLKASQNKNAKDFKNLL